MFAFFQSFGMLQNEMRVRMGAITCDDSLRNLAKILSGRIALCTFKF